MCHPRRLLRFFYFSFVGLHRHIPRILLALLVKLFTDDACDISNYLMKPRISATREANAAILVCIAGFVIGVHWWILPKC